VLLRDGKPLLLAPKIVETLLTLVQNSGRIVEKKDLMTRLWPDTFVEESNLTYTDRAAQEDAGRRCPHTPLHRDHP
jgi:DNA-binding winged helix-turn-helix (wHTH) protein